MTTALLRAALGEVCENVSRHESGARTHVEYFRPMPPDRLARGSVPCGHDAALIDREWGVNFQVTVLKILVSDPDDFAVMECPQAGYGHPGDQRPRLRGPHQAPRCASAGSRDLFSQRHVERISGGGRSLLRAESETIQALEKTIIISLASVPALRKPADRAKRRREPRLRLRKPTCGCRRTAPAKSPID